QPFHGPVEGSSWRGGVSSSNLRVGGPFGRRNSLARGTKFALERERSLFAFVERLLQFRLLGIGSLLLCRIFALERSSAGRDIILASGGKLTRERLRSCLSFVERLVQLRLLGIGSLLLCRIFALERSSAGRDIILASGGKLTGERLRSYLAFVERLLQLRLLGIGSLLLFGIFALERERPLFAFVERLFQFHLPGI